MNSSMTDEILCHPLVGSNLQSLTQYSLAVDRIPEQNNNGELHP
jgi:hypothetical protein